MTFRARPTAPRSRSWEDRDRRNMLLNIGFAVIVVVSLLLLAAAAGLSWWSDHLSAAATVNGATITKDEYRTRLKIDGFRNDYEASRLQTLLTAGRIRPQDYQARKATIDQLKQQASPIALERLVDTRIQAELAAQEGVQVTEQDVDARMTEEATTPELRHAWIIEVKPVTPTGADKPGTAEIAAAKSKAQKALADIKGGRDWTAVAKEVSTADTRDQGGDTGFVDKDSRLDPAISKALFAAAVNTPTDVVEGDDGTFRIGRVTEVVPAEVDDTLQSQIQAEGISLADYRAVLRADVVRQKLSDAVTKPYLAAGPQRHVAEIYLKAGQSEGEEGAIRARHILYAPKDDPAGAADVPADDPSWKEAETAARATYEKLKKDISQFDAIARAESDEAAAATTGGKLPYFAPGDGIDKDFAAAVFKPGLKDGQLLEPVKSQFGWHVIQIQHGPTDLEWMRKLRTQIVDDGADFGTLARDNSEDASAADGGDMGWVAKGLLGKEVEQQIFSTAVGEVSQPLVVPDDGVYLFKVIAEETREPDADQRTKLEQNVFPTWYADKKAGYEITRDESLISGV